MNLPNFVIAGFAKCGTTSLYHYLYEHPDIYLPKRKELHYFTYESILKNKSNGPKDTEMHGFHIKTWDDYKSHYTDVKNEHAVGDISPTYASYPQGVEALRNTLGDQLKVILVLRDPISRAYSNYLHLVRERRETLPFMEALLEEDERIKKGYSNFWYYKYTSSYYSKIEMVKKNFENVLVVTFENFVNDPINGIKEIYTFLGVDNGYVPENIGTQFNPGGVYKQNVLTKFIFERNKVNTFLKKIIPLNSSVKKVAHKITSAFKLQTPPIPEDAKKYLVEYFSEDVIKLQSQHNVKTKFWKHFQ